MSIVLRKENIGYLGFDNDDKQPFLIDPNSISTDEINLFRIVANENIEGALLTAPIYMSLFPTLDCNKNCSFCYYSDRLNTGSSLKIETASKIIDFCKNSGILKVNIIGGEPVSKDIWNSTNFISRGLLNNGISVSLLTNGLELSSFAKDIYKLSCLSGNLFDLVISTNPLDDVSAYRQTYLRSFNSLKENNITASINSVVLNLDSNAHINYFKKICTEHDGIISSINLLYPRVQESERFPISAYINFCKIVEKSMPLPVLYEIPFQYKYCGTEYELSEFDFLNAGCGIGRRTIAVSPIGELYACDCFLNNENYRLGTVDDSMKSVWEKATKLRREKIFKTTPLTCKTHCKAYDICDGCLAEAIEGVNPRCEFINNH
jgi:radical SAM protein with 4Fe4S-binding SPASM domain